MGRRLVEAAHPSQKLTRQWRIELAHRGIVPWNDMVFAVGQLFEALEAL